MLDFSGARNVYLVVDDGLASSVDLGEGRSGLDAQVDEARAIIEALNPGDLVGLITASRPARAHVAPPSSDHLAILEVLENLEPSEAPSDLAGALSALRTALQLDEQDDGETLVYLLSEFRAGSAHLDQPLPQSLTDLPRGVRLLASTPSQQPVPNVQIESVLPVRSVVVPGAADGSGQLIVRLERHGTQLGRDVTTVRISGEDITLVQPKVVEWEPGQTRAEVEFMLEFAVQGERQIPLTVSIDDDRLRADNERFTVLDSRPHIRVLLIDRRSFGFEPSVDRLTAGQWMARALEPVDGGTMQVVGVEPVALEPSDLRRTDVAILPRPDLLTDEGWSSLRTFVDRGGLLIITPPSDLQVHQWTEQMGHALALPWRFELEAVDHDPALELSGEQAGGRLLQMVSSELGELTRSVVASRILPLREDQSAGERPLVFTDGSPLLLCGAPQAPEDEDLGQSASTARGLIILFTVAPDLRWTNLPSKPLMVPLLHEMVRQGLSIIRKGQQTLVGTERLVGLPSSAAALVGPEGSKLPLDSGGALQRPLQHSGHWQVQDAAGLTLSSLSVNVDPLAARTESQNESAVDAWLAESGPWQMVPAAELPSSLGSSESGSPLARTLLLLLLLLVVLETVLARWFSHARMLSTTRRSTVEEAGGIALGWGR